MKKALFPLAAMALAGFALVACGNTTNKADLRPAKAFSLGETSKTAAGFDLFSTHRVNLYDGGVYEYIQTSITYGYSMNLGTTVTTTYGTYAENGTEDGVASYTLNKAAEVVLSSYSQAGGFKLQVNTASSKQTYPAELPAKTQGEKNMAQSKEDVIKEYGNGTKIFVSNNVISFKDPNGGSEKAVVSTPSGSVSSILRDFKQVQVSSSISGTGMVNYAVDYLHVYSDDSYEYVTTGITYGYSMVLGTTSVVNYGEGSYGKSEDGYTPFEMKEAKDVILNSYSQAGGFSLAINTASADQTYPAELPAKTQGEKNMAQSKEDVIKAYGAKTTVWTSDADCVMSLKAPN